MTTRVADRTDEWSSRPFTDGYAGLHALADEEFSGIVTAGRATAAFLNGTVVGVLDGSIEDFEDAEGTIRDAPSPALPLLLVMQDRSDEVRAKYYSEETALSAADHKLSDGGFTGYVELSENVLSGDYYVVYHGGRSMSVAFVGESSRLLTDDEAFEQADDEVGIYKVHPAEIEPVEIPDPPEDDGGGAVAAAGETGPEESTESEPTTTADDQPTAERDGDEPAADRDESDADEDGPSGGVAHREAAPVDSTEDDDEPTSTDPATAAADDPDDASERSTDRESDRRRDRQETQSTAEGDRAPERQDRDGSRQRREDRRTRSTADSDRSRDDDRPSERRDREESRHRDDEQAAPNRSGAAPARREDERADPPQRDSGRSDSPQRDDQRRGADGQASGAGDQPPTDPLAGPDGSDDGGSVGEAGDLERKSIPSVDPGRSWTGDESGPDAGVAFDSGPEESGSGTQATSQAQSTPQPQSQAQPSNSPREMSGRERADPEPSGRGTAQQSEPTAAVREREREIEALEDDLAALEREREELLTENDELVAENEELTAELQEVEAERDDLRQEVERLRSEIERLETRLESEGGAAGVDASVELSPQEAIDGTNLFVRYGSKGEATLEAAHDGRADREAVEANLELECHTQFDSDDAAVNGQPFEAFLESTIQYRFVHWVVHDLLYEISDTGHDAGLQDLYDALPRLDRAELNGAASVVYTEDGEEHRTQEAFDIVLRDRMGNPLAVANINDTRDAATDEMMTSLVTAATRVGETSDTLAGAFQVTASFFDPDALETAAEATGGGLLSRDKRESFVRLSRKQGFHLCLVEARDEKFHLAVPEL